MRAQRRVRKSDGTVSLCGVRFEIPSRYRHLQDVVVRYPRWDLGHVDLVNPRQGTVLCRLFPWDRHANADGQRAVLSPPSEVSTLKRSQSPEELPPLLKRILAEYSATGLPPAYVPKPASSPEQERGGER